MCDQGQRYIERREDWIANGRFDKLWRGQQPFAKIAERCLTCRQHYTFYQAVCLFQYKRNTDGALALLHAITDNAQVSPALRARAMNFRGMVLEGIGEYSKAIYCYQQAASMCAANDDSRGEARAYLNQAIIYSNFLRNYAFALKRLKKADDLLAEGDTNRVRILNERGWCLLQQALLLPLDDSAASTARSQMLAEAEAVLHQTHALCLEQKNQYFQAICEINLGTLAYVQNNLAQAQDWYHRALNLLAQVGGSRLIELEIRFYQAHVALGESLEAAQAQLQALVRFAKASRAPHFVAITQLSLADLAEKRQKHEEAWQWYSRALDTVEQTRALQETSETRLDIQAQWLNAHRKAIQCALRLGKIREAFMYAERTRARLLFETLNASPQPIYLDAPPELLEELYLCRQQLHQEYTRFLAQQANGKLPPRHQIEERIQSLREELQPYNQEQISHEAPPELSVIQNKLSSNAIVLSYICLDDKIVVFGLTRTRLQYIELDISLEVIRGWLTNDGQLEDITDFSSSLYPALGLFYNVFLSPILNWLTRRTTIYIVPDTELRYFPFHLLTPDSGQSHLLTKGNRRCLYLPSASILTRLPSPKEEDTALIVAYNGLDLRLIEEHGQRIAKTIGATMLRGPDIPPETLLTVLSNHSLLYLAGHNVFHTPAPVDSGFLITKDRLLTMLEIQQLRLPGGRVVLGACDTGKRSEYGGDWQGLTSAFLQAGAAQIIGTLWQVSEVATCLLMDLLWKAWDIVEPIHDLFAALRTAQEQLRGLTLADIYDIFASYNLDKDSLDFLNRELDTINKRRAGAQYPLDHPYFWGAFIVLSE